MEKIGAHRAVGLVLSACGDLLEPETADDVVEFIRQQQAEIEELREALKFGQAQWESMAQQVEAAKALAEIYFEIAEETMPANEIRKKRDQKIAERAK